MERGGDEISSLQNMKSFSTRGKHTPDAWKRNIYMESVSECACERLERRGGCTGGGRANEAAEGREVSVDLPVCLGSVAPLVALGVLG